MSRRRWMNQSTFAFVSASMLVTGAVMLGAACASAEDSSKPSTGQLQQAIETGVVGGATVQLINEVLVDPPGVDDNFEYVELRGTPGGLLTGFYLLVVDGSGATSGQPDQIINLSTACSLPADAGATPCAFGSNGLLMIKASATAGHPAAAGTTVVAHAGFSIENGAESVILIYSPTTAITAATDFDSPLPAGAVIADAIGWKDAGNGTVYGGATLALDTPEAITRFVGNDNPISPSAWYGGNIAGNANTGTAYGATGVTANTPAGAQITPGAPNFGPNAADTGPPDQAVLPDTVLPEAASEVAQDAVNNTDTGTAPTDTGTAPTDTGTAPADTATGDTTAPADTATGDTATVTDVAADTRTDAGADTRPADTGTAPPVDTGTEPEDTATTPTDTGTSVVDTGIEDAGDVAPVDGVAEDSGCGCRVPSNSGSSTAGALTVLALGLAIASRRRR